jgi:hypothetical protein
LDDLVEGEGGGFVVEADVAEDFMDFGVIGKFLYDVNYVELSGWWGEEGGEGSDV